MRTVDQINAEMDLRFYVEMFQSDECQCGKYKQPKRALCLRCYKRLPQEMQRALYARLGNGLERAYEEAVRWLG